MPAELVHLNAADHSNAEIIETLLADGGVIVEGLLDADLLARFNAELDPIIAATSPDRATS